MKFASSRPPIGPQLHHNRALEPSANTLPDTQEASDGPSASVGLRHSVDEHDSKLKDEIERAQSPPPQYPLSEASSSSPPPSPRPPPFSSLYTSTLEVVQAYKQAVTEAGASASVPAYAPRAPESPGPPESSDTVAETKAALPQDTKGEPSKKEDDSEPPPAYSEGSSPLESFTYLMASAGGPASIITQVQQGGPPINTLGGALYYYTFHYFWRLTCIIDVGADENITMDLRYNLAYFVQVRLC